MKAQSDKKPDKKSGQKYYPITIALAGMFQAAALARQIARTGKMDETAFETSVRSLFVTDPKSISEIYGNISNLHLGLKELLKIFAPQNAPQEPEIRYYVTSMIYFEQRLAKHSQVNTLLDTRIHQAMNQVNYFSPTHPQVLANLADIYTNTIGTYRYHIKVVGAAVHVSNQETMNKVRTSLLAGVRSAILWRQMGGSQFQFFFSRKAIVKMAKALLEEPDYLP